MSHDLMPGVGDDDRYIDLNELKAIAPEAVHQIFEKKISLLRFEKTADSWSLKDIGIAGRHEDLGNSDLRLMILKKNIPGDVNIDRDEGYGKEYDRLKEKTAEELAAVIDDSHLRMKAVERHILSDKSLQLDEEIVAPVIKCATRLVLSFKALGEENKVDFKNHQEVSHLRTRTVDTAYQSVSSLLNILRRRPDVKGMLDNIIQWVEGKTIRHSVFVGVEYFIFLMAINDMIKNQKFWQKYVITPYANEFEKHPYAVLTGRLLEIEPQMIVRHRINEHGLLAIEVPANQVWYTLGALHHDVWGKLPNPDQAEFFENDKPFDPVRIEQHVLIGEENLRRLGFPETVSTFAGNHHMRNAHARGYGNQARRLRQTYDDMRARKKGFKRYHLTERFLTDELDEYLEMKALAFAPLAYLSYIDSFVAMKEKRGYRPGDKHYSPEDALQIIQKEIIHEPVPMFDFLSHDMMVLWLRGQGVINKNFPMIAEMKLSDLGE